MNQELPSLDLRWQAPSEQTPNNNDENAFALPYYLEILARRKRTILAFVGVFLLLSLAISFLMAPTYRAQGSVELNPNNPKVTKFEDMVSDASKPDAFLRTQVDLFRSASLAARVIENLHLATNPVFNPDAQQAAVPEGFTATLKKEVAGSVSTVKGWLHLKYEKSGDPVIAQLQQQQILQMLFAQNLDVQPRVGTNIISVAFSSTDPILARNVTNQLITEFVNWQIDRRLDSTKSAKTQLEAQIRTVRNHLSQAEQRLNQFANETGIVSLDSKLNLIYQQLEKINQSLAAVEAERIAKKETYEQARKSDVASLPLVLQNALIQRLKTEYVDLMSEYEKLNVVYKENYPEVKRIRAKMQEINKKISNEQEQILKSLKAEYLAALQVEKALSGKAEEKKAMALKANELGTQYKVLEREVETNKQIYLSLLERSKEIDANVGTDLGNLRLVDYAAIPLAPYKPNIVLYSLIAVFMGFLGGTGWAFFKEFRDSTVKRVEEISDQLWIPILSVVPFTKKKNLLYRGSNFQGPVPSAFTEAIWFARVSILFSCSTENSSKCLLITSTAAGEGKSTISFNLARSFAATGEKVLLVDADLHKVSHNERFTGNGGDTHGLTQLLGGKATATAVIHKTDVPNLYFIPSGLVRLPERSEQIDSNRMKTLVEGTMKRFDRIIIDGPPFGSDVLILGNCADAVVLITALGQTERAALRFARKYLADSNCRLLGSIVNRVDLSRFPETRHYLSSYSSRGRKIDDFLVCSNEK